MSTEQQQGSWQEPGQRMVLTWPGQVPTPLGALLQEAGVAMSPPQDELAALQEQVDALHVQTQRIAEELHESSGQQAEASNYEQWTVTELKDELESRNLGTSGNKDELIIRLEEDDAG